jgi:hypothetical protein
MVLDRIYLDGDDEKRTSTLWLYLSPRQKMLSSAGRFRIKLFICALKQVKNPSDRTVEGFVSDTPGHDRPEDRCLNIFWALPNFSRNVSLSMLDLNCWLYIAE